MSNIIDRIGPAGRFFAIALGLVLVAPVVHAEDDTEAGPSGHWYAGGSTGYLKPDGNRMSGNTRTLGIQGGYQFNDRWSVETGYQQDAGDLGPGKEDLKMYDLEFIRHWGDQYRFLMEYGYTHIALDPRNPALNVDSATAGFHIGTGVSAFLTRNLELRGDAKVVYSQNDKNLDGVGTLSLNWHFVKSPVVAAEEEEVLGESSQPQQTLPETTYREPVQAEEAPEEAVAPAPVQQPVEEPAVAPAPVADAPVEEPVAAPVPRTTFTLINFGFNSIDVDAQYGSQLDTISADIKNNNSRAVIEGHTDDKGSNTSNKILSMDRAIVVKRKLKERGVSGDDLSVVGYGEEQPVAPNDTEENRAKNRRVEVKVYDKQ